MKFDHKQRFKIMTVLFGIVAFLNTILFILEINTFANKIIFGLLTISYSTSVLKYISICDSIDLNLRNINKYNMSELDYLYRYKLSTLMVDYSIKSIITDIDRLRIEFINGDVRLSNPLNNDYFSRFEELNIKVLFYMGVDDKNKKDELKKLLSTGEIVDMNHRDKDILIIIIKTITNTKNIEAREIK